MEDKKLLKSKMIHYGHLLQVIWIVIGLILQIWIGGIKGFVVMMVGAILFFINAMIISIKEWRTNNYKKVLRK